VLPPRSLRFQRDKEGVFMAKAVSSTRKYAAVAGLGALAGGLSVAIATKAIPRMMSGAMEGMREPMMACIGDGGQGLPDT
jgi:hypothetical protein